MSIAALLPQALNLALQGISIYQQSRGGRPPIPVGGIQPGLGFAAPLGGGGLPGFNVPGFGAAPLGAAGFGRRPKIGRFSGQQIPPGTKERISSRTGQIILTEVRRGRGLTGRDLKGFRRTLRLVKSVGMVPKGLRSARRGFYRRKRAA